VLTYEHANAIVTWALEAGDISSTPVSIELGDALVSDLEGHGGRRRRFCDQQATRFQKTYLLLISDRRHRRHCLEMRVKGRRAHIGEPSQFFDAKRPRQTLAQHPCAFRDTLGMTVGVSGASTTAQAAFLARSLSM
jgi:hypothetical protein